MGRRSQWGRRPVWSTKRILLLVLVLIVAAGSGVLLRMKSPAEKSWSWVIGDKTILIDAGHGGVDPGAVGVTQVLEKDITLAISKRLNALVQQAGGKAIMVREEDVDLGTSTGLLKRKREDLAQRIQLAIDNQADVYLSIHANSFPNEKLTGPHVFYHSDSAEGKLLAQSIQQELNKVAGGKRVAKGNQDLFILKKGGKAAVTIEVGFLSNPIEEQTLTDPDYQQRLAMAIYQGLADYFSKLTNQGLVK